MTDALTRLDCQYLLTLVTDAHDEYCKVSRELEKDWHGDNGELYLVKLAQKLYEMDLDKDRTWNDFAWNE
jgi:hypothetical protein